MVRPRGITGESDEAVASAAPPRWGGASVPARNKPRQDPLKKLIK